MVLRVLCGYCKKRTQRSVQREKNGNNNEQFLCNRNEIMVEAYNDCKKGDLNNSRPKTAGVSTNQDNVPISGSGRNSFAEETTMESK